MAFFSSSHQANILFVHTNTFKVAKSNFVFPCLGEIEDYLNVAEILYEKPKKELYF